MRSVSLDDIERIEVLRGSNSATYGARAMFGVVNIITRESADTLGRTAHVAAGQGGLRDASARVGWGNEAAGFRLEGESAILANPADAHTANVFDGSIRGHTDQFILKFRKPRR